MPQGIVKQFDPAKGTGIIEEEQGGREIRVHRSGIADGGGQGLHTGDIVEYEIGRSRMGGHTAVNVVRIGWEEDEAGDEGREWTF